MSAYDPSGIDQVPFDGSYDPLPDTRIHYASRNHGPTCQPSNPEISCVCGEDEREHLSAEASELREARALGYTELPANMAADHQFWTRHDRPQRQAS